MPSWATSSSTCGPVPTIAACSSMICGRPSCSGPTATTRQCWLRQLTPYAHPRNRRMSCCGSSPGWTAPRFPTTARLTGPVVSAGRLPTINDWVRGIPLVDRKVRESQTQQRRQGKERKMGLEDGLLRGDRGDHLRGKWWAARHGQGHELVRPGQVLERRRAFRWRRVISWATKNGGSRSAANRSSPSRPTSPPFSDHPVAVRSSGLMILGVDASACGQVLHRPS